MTRKQPHEQPHEADERTDAAEPEGATGAPADETAPPLEAEPDAAVAAAELELLRDRHLRLAAEYDNFRKRTDRERAESWMRAQGQLVERLLDALDDLQRVAHVDPEKTSVAALLEGVQLVERKLLRVLEAAGLERVEAEGRPFDPSVHEALMLSPTDEREADHTVAEEFQKGYSFKGTLLRPARVRVHKYEG